MTPSPPPFRFSLDRSGSESAYFGHDPMTLLTRNRYPMTVASFEAGTSDREPWTDAQKLAAASRQAGMPQVCLIGILGGHDWDVWQQSFTAALSRLIARVRVFGDARGERHRHPVPLHSPVGLVVGAGAAQVGAVGREDGPGGSP